MKEEFLHYLWKYCLYDADNLFDNAGNKIIVRHPGEYNRDSGPDFFNARVIIGGTEWAGNVEIHTKSSHFDSHGHNSDHAFDNVILHVVDKNDRRVYNALGRELLTVRIIYDSSLYDKYISLVNNPLVIACQEEIGAVDPFYLRHWLNALAVERLNDKSGMISRIFSETANDWEETFYRILSRYFGFHVNTEPFEMLATAIPYKIIRKHADNRFQVEALLYGTAGMLDEGLFKEALDDRYYRELTREFRILSSKYSLKPVHGWLWKFSRLRPVNFPTIRISQLSAMLTVSGGLFSKVIEATHLEHLKKNFEVTAADYWNEHYVFGKKSRGAIKNTGEQSANILLINAVIPVLYTFGRERGNHEFCERALGFLGDLLPERNSIISEWENAGVKADTALCTQALLQLRNEYCRRRRCLDCRIGARLISTGKELKRDDELMLEP